MKEVDLSQLAVERPEVERRRPQARRLLTRYGFPGALILGFVSLVGWSARDYFFPPRPVQVVPVFATQSEVRTEGATLFNAAGWVEPRPTLIRVVALAPGVVEKLFVVEDEWVTAGQPIAELVKDDAALAHERAVADRELAAAELEQAKAVYAAALTRFQQPVHLEALLAQADANVAKIETSLKNLPFETTRAEAEVRFAENDYERHKNASTSVSDRELDRALADLKTAGAQLAELKNRKQFLEQEYNANYQKREALNVHLQLLADETREKDEAKAKVDAAEASLKQKSVIEAEALLRLNRMTVRAPVDGRIYHLHGMPGARVGTGVMTAMFDHDGSSVVTMYRPDSLQVRVDVRFEDIPKVSLGQTVQISNPALTEPILGSVLFVSSVADIQKNTLQVKVAIDDAPSFFKPEMLVDVTFLAPRPNDSDQADVDKELKLLVPERLVMLDEGAPFIWLADQSGGYAVKTNVVTGQQGNDGMWEIVEGLDIGSRLITGNLAGLKDGDRLRVTGEADGESR
ncbi:MAG: HlyD family efflux transporter periplasmic adaptor subunit [Mariniblastus sp.]|nr:HlyD family efflux transporter periplasmic adaptor subunit [Mariniblastus sp.]